MRPTPRRHLLVFAVVAALAGGGSSYAASQITGRDIKDGTVRSPDVAGLRLHDLAPSAVAQLQGGAGQPGPAGPAGPVGPAGPAGPAAPAGVQTSTALSLGTASAPVTILEIDGLLVTARCQGSGDVAVLRFTLDTDTDETRVYTRGPSNPSSQLVAAQGPGAVIFTVGPPYMTRDTGETKMVILVPGGAAVLGDLYYRFPADGASCELASTFTPTSGSV